MTCKLNRILGAASLVLAGCLAANVSSASVMTFMTGPGATTSGGAVSASATFTTSPGQLDVTLNDLLPNPTDVAQLLSGLDFSISGFTSGSLTSSSGTEISVSGTGTWSLGTTGATGWALTSSGFELCVICSGTSGLTTSGPAHLIIGPPATGDGMYDAANGSIAGNGPHNPFLNQMATFDISIPELLATDSVSSATFRFGTTYGQDTVPGTGTSEVPEPGTLALLGAGLAALAFARRRRSKGVA